MAATSTRAAFARLGAALALIAGCAAPDGHGVDAGLAVQASPLPLALPLAAAHAAAPVVRAAAAPDPARLMTHLRNGRKRDGDGAHAEAIAAFDQALVIAPGDPRALAGRGGARMHLGELDSAHADLVLALDATDDPRLRATVSAQLHELAALRGDDERGAEFADAGPTTAPLRARTCRASHQRSERPSQRFADWLALHRELVARGRIVDPVRAGRSAPHDSAGARAALCHRGAEDACAGPPPWVLGVAGGALQFGPLAVDPAPDGALRVQDLEDMSSVDHLSLAELGGCARSDLAIEVVRGPLTVIGFRATCDAREPGEDAPQWQRSGVEYDVVLERGAWTRRWVIAQDRPVAGETRAATLADGDIVRIEGGGCDTALEPTARP